MNSLRTIVAFAFAIAIALSFPDGSPKGCVALSVPTRETVTTEISAPTAGIENNPLEEVILRAVTFAREILASIGAQFARFRERFLSTLAAIEAPFVQPSGGNAADDTSRNRRRRWADPLTDLSSRLSHVPNQLEGLATSIPTAIVHPFEFASNLANTVGGLAVNGAETATLNGFKYLWTFLTTQGLPWLHTALKQLDKTTVLPPSIRELITSFNASYEVAKLLGYVK